MDEEYFGVIVTSLLGTEHHPEARKLFQTKIIRGFERRPKLASKVMSTVIPVSVNSGGKKIGTAPAYDIDTPKFDRVIIKILRGLLYHETGLTVPRDHVVKWNVINEPLPLPSNIFNKLRTRPINSFGDGVFRYKVLIHNHTAESFWLFSFYDGAMFHGSIFENRGSPTNMQKYDAGKQSH